MRTSRHPPWVYYAWPAYFVDGSLQEGVGEVGTGKQVPENTGDMAYWYTERWEDRDRKEGGLAQADGLAGTQRYEDLPRQEEHGTELADHHHEWAKVRHGLVEHR